MNYFIREMHGSFEVARLLGLSDGIEPGEDDKSESEILASCFQVPPSSLTNYLMPNHKDFAPHWFKGPSFTYDGHFRGGHHSGKAIQILASEAKKILESIKEKTNDNN